MRLLLALLHHQDLRQEVRHTAVSMVVAMANNGMPYSAPPLQPPINSSLPPVNLATQNGAPQDYYENNRLYHGYRKGKYLFPCDESEKDRMDIYHKFFSVARKEKLHSAPITPNYDLRILDLGTGTGIWAIDMADKYFHDRAEVTGLDLVNIQPRQIPPNLAFHIRDIESPWQSLGQDSYDLIHMRTLNGSISDWPDMYEKAFKHLKPGYGWLEHVEIDMQPRCDDGTLPHDSALLQWHGYLMDAMKRADRPMDYNHNTGHLLRQQGFIDVHEEVIPIPFNPWPKDPHQKDIGRWYNLGLTEALEALSLAPFTRMFRWSQHDVANLTSRVRNEVVNRRIHAYCNLHIWIARRPPGA